MGRSKSSDGMTGPRVLVAESDNHARSILAWVLRERGYDVMTADQPEALLSAAAARQTDIVLLALDDPALPDTVSRLRSGQNANALCIILAAQTDGAKQMVRAGADDWVAKPFNVAE